MLRGQIIGTKHRFREKAISACSLSEEHRKMILIGKHHPGRGVRSLIRGCDFQGSGCERCCQRSGVLSEEGFPVICQTATPGHHKAHAPEFGEFGGILYLITQVKIVGCIAGFLPASHQVSVIGDGVRL